MPATKFICPNGGSCAIGECLIGCHNGNRCMAQPTLAALANSVKPRNLEFPSVTELIAGTREIYLKHTTDYAVNPDDLLFAAHGSALHKLAEEASTPGILTELRLNNGEYTGQVDSYGEGIVEDGKYSLVDMKVTSSYKAMRVLGLYKVDVPTGEVYKTGTKKGQPKTRKEVREGGVRDLFEWAVQVNAYRLLLEEAGYRVDDMFIQMLVRDYSLKTAGERGIDRPTYLVKINKISDHWLKLWLKTKAKRLQTAMDTGITKSCSSRETWKGRKCNGYCPVAEQCKALANNESEVL